ncbi:MAG: biopolymer transporter ExbD [Pseudomonadota bacterium]
MAFSSAGAGSTDVLSEINITPLVDVMLVLMVVFILTAPMLNNVVRINLPKTAATAAPDAVKAVTVSVDGHSQVFIDKRAIELAALEPELKGLLAANPELALSLQADETVPYKAVAKVMATISRSGVSKLSVLTAPGG